MASAGNSSDPYFVIQQQLQQMKQQISDITQRPFYLPVLNADPAVDEGNIWLLEDGRLRVRNAAGVIKEYAPVGSAGSSSSGTAKPAAPAATRTYTGTWGATWTQSYRSSGAQRSEPELYYGNGDSFNGTTKALIGFPASTIAAALAGSTVVKCEIYFHNLYSWWNSGSNVRFGIHNNVSKPSTYGGSVRTNVNQIAYGRPQAKWAPISTEFGVRFRDGTGKGVLIDQQTSDHAYYGFGAGLTGSGNPPMIRITYVK